MERRIFLSSPAMCGKEKEFINQAFEDNWIAPLGPNVDALENEICEYVGAEYAVAMNTGTAAMDKITDKKEFSDIDEIEMAPICGYGKPNYWLSCFTLKNKSKVRPGDIIAALDNENIESRPIWKPMHLQPLYKNCGYFAHGYDVSADIFDRGLCLPSDVNMNNCDIERVISVVRRCFYF